MTAITFIHNDGGRAAQTFRELEMKSLSKHDTARVSELTEKLNAEFAKLQNEHNVLSEAVAKYNSVIEAFNETIQEARGFAEDIVSEIDAYMSDRSEKWLEGERGEAYEAWKSEWENVSLEDLEPVEEPAEPDYDCDVLDGLPLEPES